MADETTISTETKGAAIYRRLPRVYVIGPYTADTREDVEKNINEARNAAKELWGAGFAVFCAHTNSAHMDDDTDVGYQTFLNGGMSWLYFADVAYRLRGWKRSPGSCVEVTFCNAEKIPVFDSLRDIKKWKEKRWDPCQ